MVAILGLLERLFTPAGAWLAVEGSLLVKIVCVGSLGTLYSLRLYAQRLFVGDGEARIFEQVITSLARGDVLRQNPLPTEDARTELAQAVYHAANCVAQDAPNLVADCIASLVLACVVLALEPLRVVLLLVAVVAVATVALAWSSRRLRNAARQVWRAHQQVFLSLVDALEGRLELAAHGRTSEFLVEARRRTRELSAATRRTATATALSGRLPLLLIASAAATVLSIGMMRNEIQLPAAHLALLAGAIPAFAGFGQGIHAIVRSAPWTESVVRLLRLPAERSSSKHPLPRLPATLALQGVTFSYGPQGSALSNVDLRWEPGRVLALAGKNGSGKSTCLRLLLGLSAPTAGAVTLGGVPLQDIDLDAWRERVAFLPQRAHVPPLSDVGAAIRFVAPDASVQAILDALDRVGVLASLSARGADPLAISMDTLSSGERQRVVIARLLCRHASLYVLDEPDANLDRDGVTMCAALIRELARTSMVALAVHASELTDVADTVVTLDGGRVIRAGERRSSPSFSG